MKWNIWNFTHVMRSHLVRYFLQNSARKNFHNKCQNSRRFLLNKVFLFKYMFVVSESKWTQKFAFIVSSACKQSLSIIWGKECFYICSSDRLFVSLWLAQMYLYAYLKIIDLVFSTRFCILLLRKIWHDCSAI